jgi:hypothetical protein
MARMANADEARDALKCAMRVGGNMQRTCEVREVRRNMELRT